MFPVDLPAVDEAELTSAGEQYLSGLDLRSSDDEEFQSSQTSKVRITRDLVRRLQLFEDEQPDCSLLALHPPDDPTRVLALFLHGAWWPVDHVLRTSSSSRSGLMAVQSLMERVIVFLLSQVLERSSEEEEEEAGMFSLNPPTESCKLLWRDGQAVGFYTIKHKGSLSDSWSSQAYLLPVLDTLLVRRSWRRRGFALQMLEDFCSSFNTETFLGVSSPLSPGMAAVCRRFLLQHQQHQERLYEVEAPGGWTQRRNIWLNLQLGRYPPCAKAGRHPSSGDQDGGGASSQEREADGCRLDRTSSSICSQNIPPDLVSSEQQIKPFDPIRRRRSPSSRTTETGCSPAAHIHDADSGPPTGPTRSRKTNWTLTRKPSLHEEPGGEEPEKTRRATKRVRRT